jgi:hypothetical protein
VKKKKYNHLDKMKTSIIKISIVILIMVIIPGACILVSKGTTRFSEEDLTFSGIPGTLTLYYLLMTAIAVVLSIIKKIISNSNQQK